jgi:hypothetical protein
LQPIGEIVGPEELDLIIEAGIYAPSGHNTQPWHFTVIQNKELINTNNDYISQLNKEKELNKIKKYKQRVKYQKESLYICHRCCLYKTIYKSDINKVIPLIEKHF